MATDAQGRTLSDDGNYYWDGAAWQPVQESGAEQAGGTSGSEGANLEDYSGDGSDLTGPVERPVGGMSWLAPAPRPTHTAPAAKTVAPATASPRVSAERLLRPVPTRRISSAATEGWYVQSWAVNVERI